MGIPAVRLLVARCTIHAIAEPLDEVIACMSTALNFPIEPVRSAITDGLHAAAEVIKQEAIERAPKETGYLRNTAATAAEGLEAAVGFDGPYADKAARGTRLSPSGW